ncbi:MAG: type II CAAX endopeptidase family protein [Pseudomonadota bacterium]
MLSRSTAWGDLRLFFGLTFLLSWGVGGLYLLTKAQFNPFLGPLNQTSVAFLIINSAPSLAALITALVRGGPIGLIQLLGSLFKPFAWYWLVLSIFLVPLIALGLSYAAPLWDSSWPVQPSTIFTLPLVMFTLAQLTFNIAPFGEELGWRGYALPRLIDRIGPIPSALLLGAIWVVWHIPGFFIAGVMAPSMTLFGWWALATMGLSVIMTFLYVRANGNVIVAGVIPHFIINAMANAGAWESRPAECIAMTLVACVLAASFALSSFSAARAPALQ